jgi:peptide/nickel transport system permease protein
MASMRRYILRRLLILPVLLTGVSILIFGLISLLTPYERAALYVTDIPKRQGAMEAIIEKYGLDDPIHVQYFHWISNVLKGDLGWSKTGKSSVIDVIKRRLPATIELAFFAAIPMIGFGIFLGVLAAIKHNKFVDQILRVNSIIGWSIPIFVFALLLLMVFYAELDWFPPGRLSDWAYRIVLSDEFTRYTQINTIDGILNLRWDITYDAIKHLILPVVALAYLNMAIILRVTRSSMLETLRQDYMTTARSKGLHERRVINRHALPNALIPVVTIAGLLIIGLLNGVVITETVFNYPGLGSFLAESAITLDVISVLGIALYVGVILVIGNLIVDVLYAFLDPRIRLE